MTKNQEPITRNLSAFNFQLSTLLRDLSRSFYLTLKALPPTIQSQIALAYLLARTADTIADTEIIEVSERLNRLIEFRRLLFNHSDLNEIRSFSDSIEDNMEGSPLCEPWHEGKQARTEASPPLKKAEVSHLGSEKLLLQKLPEMFEFLDSFQKKDQDLIGEVVGELTVGMELDLKRFPKKDEVIALETFQELEEYTYHVAGCVGPFWTKICISHITAFNTWDPKKMCDLGIRFGKALQWTNILRDLPRDLQNGRCYLSRKDLIKVTLNPSELKDPHHYRKLAPLYFRYLSHAIDHYRAAWQYVVSIPRSCFRVRLACVLPIWIGLETLVLLGNSKNPLDPKDRIRIPRSKVYTILLKSMVLIGSNHLLGMQIEKLFRKIEATIASNWVLDTGY